MKGGLEMKVQGSKTRKAAPAAEYKEGNQKGSLLLEAIVVLGMIATFTPMLYKHVADRRADIENINRANTLLYLQHKAEDYLKDPDNITALVTELGHNQHKEIYPSEMGAGDNFDGRYIVGIRREDEENKPVLKAMIIDTVHTGSDLRAAKVAELIGISAGIYTAVDPDAAWGINGIWSEPLSRYFDTTNIPTGAVAITTEYNKAKYRVNISDILVDADLDMGEFEVTAEQINAVAIAAQNGTLDQLIAQDVRASNKVVAGKKLCVGGEAAENCIESWEGLGGKDDSDLRLVQECNAGMTESCISAFVRDLNTSCSKVDEVYDRFGAAYPSPKIYNLTYGSGTQYTDVVLTKCEGTSFIVDNISTLNLTNPVEQVGGSAFAITQPGWYQITLMGEGGWLSGYGHTWQGSGAGGILISNHQYNSDDILTIKAVKGGNYTHVNDQRFFGGAGIALWDILNTTGAPTLVAGGGAVDAVGGGGYNGGYKDSLHSGNSQGYSWDGTTGNNTTYCSSAPCNIGAVGGRWWSTANKVADYGGTGYCGSGYTCTTITGGNASVTDTNYPASTYGNWMNNTLTGGAGYVSIVYCGTSESDCPTICTSDSDCGYHEACDLSTARCGELDICGIIATCNNGNSSACATAYSKGFNTSCANLIASCSDLSYPTAAKICSSATNCVETCCSSSSLALPKNQEYVVSSSISTASNYSAVYNLATIPICAGQFRFNLMGEGGVWSSYSPNTWNAAGGGRIVTKSFTENTNITFKVAPGGYNSSTQMGGAGVGLYEGSEIKVAVGGGGSYGPAGGGYKTGTLQSGGTYGKGFVSGSTTCYCNNSNPSNCDWAFGCGGMGNNGKWPVGHVWGGSAFLDPSYTQESYTIGGNYTRDPYSYSTASWGNHGPGWAKMTFLGK